MGSLALDEPGRRATTRPAPNPRVALVYPAPFGAAGVFGGGERYAHQLGTALSRRTPTRLITFGEVATTHRDDKLDVVTYPILRYLGGNRNNPLSAAFLRELRWADVVHCLIWNTVATDLATIFGRLTGKRVFVTDVGGGAGISLATRLRLGGLVDRFLLIAAQGGTQFERYRERWRIIFAGIDTVRFQTPANPQRQGVLFVGRLLPHKGIDILIRALPEDVPLTVVGRPYETRYFELLQRLAMGKNVQFVTNAEDDDIVNAYQRAAVSVLPSVYRSVYGDFAPLPELLGFAAMEAMACGAAVIATDVGGMSEVVRNEETGLLVAPSDVDGLRRALQRLLGDALLRQRLGAAARAMIEREFTWPIVAERCLEAYVE